MLIKVFIVIAALVAVIIIHNIRAKSVPKLDAPDCATIADFLKLESTDNLRKIARNLISIELVYEGGENIYIPSKGTSLYFRTRDCYRVCVAKTWKSIKSQLTYNVPQNLLNATYPDALTALKILEERGDDPNAAFILGILYEFGLSSDISTNINEAKSHYEIAEAQNSNLIPLLNVLRRKWLFPERICEDKREVIFNNMLPMRLQNTPDEELRECYDNLNERDIEDIKLIATLGIVYYQSIGSYFSTAVLGVLTTETSVKQRHLAINNFIYKPNDDVALAMTVKVWNAARSGDPYAIAVCYALKLKY